MAVKVRLDQGFTIIELLVYIILVGMLTTLVITTMFDYWGTTANLINDNETLVERADAADTLRNYLNVGAQLLDQNDIADPHPAVVDPSDVTGTHWLLIHAIPGTTTMPASGSYSPLFYFTEPSVDRSKNFIMNGAQPYYDDYVLYLDGTTQQLLLRKLINPNATNDQYVSTCAPEYVTPTCPVDLIVSNDVSAVDLSYYSKSDVAINYTSSIDPITLQYNGPDFAYVEVVSITIHLSRKAVINGSAATNNEVVIRVALRN